MNQAWPAVILVAIVAGILAAERQEALKPAFRWLPVPLWCYALPLIASSLGWLPLEAPAYRAILTVVLPVALSLLLLGVDLRAIARMGWRIIAACAFGSLGVVVGAPLAGWVLQRHLPPEAWKGIGSLAATWTGGSLNLLALKAALDTPADIFTALIIVDALIAYTWMALLVALAGVQGSLDRWLRATPLDLSHAPASSANEHDSLPRLAACALIGIGLALLATLLAQPLPLTTLVTTRQGWTVLLVTTGALGASLIGPIRRMSTCGAALGYPVLYLVLATLGAQASLRALRLAPVWIAVGVGTALIHGVVMMLGGRWLRLPFGMVATASQANLGGVVSTPLVGAVYDQRLVPVGLLLAIACNAVGTYWGLFAAWLARFLTG